MKRRIGKLALLALALIAAPGCGGGGDDGPGKAGAGGSGGSGGGGGSGGKLPTTAPEEIKKVTSDGFKDPLDAVVKHDGSEIYFTAFTLEPPSVAAVFRVPTSGGSANPIHTGTPFGFPTGLVLSCDSTTLYIADKAPSTDSETDSDEGAIFTLSTSGGTPLKLAANGLGQPTGLALSEDCKTLYVSGTTSDGAPAVFTLPAGGGDATILFQGAPLLSPAGLHVDSNNVAWVMDHLGIGPEGEGALYSITASGEIKPVLGNLGGGVTMGVSLVAGGITAVMPSVDPITGKAELVTASTETGEVKRIEAPEMVDPGGVRTARKAGVLAITDHDGNSIFIAK